MVVETPDGNKVELYYQQVTLSPLCMSSLKDIESERITKLPEVKFQFSRYATVGRLISASEESIADWLKKDVYAQFPDRNFMKLWMLPLDTRKNVFINTLIQGTKANPSFSYKLYIDASYIEEETVIGEADWLP